MNKFVLVAMDKENYTKEELKKNAKDAATATYVYPSASAASAAAYHAYANDSVRFDYWLAIYFEITGEDKQEYINAIEGSSN